MEGNSQRGRKKDTEERLGRYRLRWNDVTYQPGEGKVVGYNAMGEAVAEKSTRTAGKPHQIKLSADRNVLSADGKDLSFVTVSIPDKEGNLCSVA